MTDQPTPREIIEVPATDLDKAVGYIASMEHKIYKIERNLALGGRALFDAAARQEMQETSDRFSQIAANCTYVLGLAFGDKLVRERIKEKADALIQETERMPQEAERARSGASKVSV